MKKNLLLFSMMIASLAIFQSNAQTNLISSWNANLLGYQVTGTANTEAAKWGWAANVTQTWGTANGSGVRFMDLTATSSPVHYNSDGTTFIGREFLYRWDGAATYSGILSLGVGDGTTTTATGIPLSACSNYTFSGLFEWWNNGSVTPIYKFSIATSPTGGTIIGTTTITSSTTKNKLQPVSFSFMTPAGGGSYYLLVQQTNATSSGTGGMIGLTNLSICKNNSLSLSVSPSSISLSNVTKSANIMVSGNSLRNAVSISAPAGITLSQTSVAAADAQCGVNVTATYDYTTTVSSDTIRITTDTVGGTITKKIPFTYTKPAISVFERNIEVENNNKSYPLYVSSVNNTVDSLFVSASTGFSVAKSGYSTADFVSGTGSIKVDVNSTAAVGNSGKLIFFVKNLGVVSKLDSINVKSVTAYTRYYIRHNASGLFLGNDNTNLLPALTAKKGASTQKFLLRRFNPTSLTDTTYYIVQDSVYRAMRKVASSTWSTEFGIPSNEAKWTIQTKANGTTTLTDSVTNGLFGTDLLTANSLIYDNKTYTAGGNMEWLLQAVAPEIVTTGTFASMSSSVGNIDTKTITVSGFDLQGNITAAISGTNANQFSVSPVTLTANNATVPVTSLTVTYTPTEVSSGHTATLTLSSANATSKTFSLSASSTGTDVKQLSSVVKAFAVNGNLIVTGADNYAVYNVQGIKVADVKNNTSDTYVTLKPGVYLVKTDAKIQKVLVK